MRDFIFVVSGHGLTITNNCKLKLHKTSDFGKMK